MRPQSTMRQHGLSADADDIIWDLALSPKGDLVACASSDGEVRLMRTATGQLARRIPIGSPINSVAFSPTTGDLAIASGDGLLVVAGSDGTEQRTVARLRESVESVAWTPDGQRLAYCMGTPRLVVRALDGKQPAMELPGHRGPIRQVTMLTRRRAVTCSSDLAIRTWDVFSGDCLATLLGHTQAVNALAIRYPQGHIISGSDDLTVRIWDPDLAQCICVLEDHKAPIWDVSCSPDGIWAASASEDRTVRLWNLQAEQLVHVFEFRTPVYSVLFTKDGSRLCVASEEGLSLHDLAKLRQRLPPKPRGVRYSSAKMVLCGDTGVGKSSLADRLIRNRYICHESTHGLRILPLPQLSNSSRTVEREVWLWDLAGQSEYRLIHQLFLDYTSLAMVLFDPHDPASLNQLPEWEKRLKLAVRSDPEKILVAAKMDLDGQCLSPHTIDDYRRLHGYLGFVSTSAKTGLGRTRLLNMLRRAIPWRRITPTTTHATFRCLRDAVLKLRTGETAVLDFKTLAAGIRRVGRTPGPADQDIRYVLTLLSNENVVRQLDYGSLVLLRPELLNAYASSLIHAATSFAGEIGGLDVADVITGKFPVKRMRRLPPHEERVLLPAVVQLLESRSLCLRMTLSDGRDRLIFPSQCTRKWERKPAHHILLRYGFAGQVSNFFVTLAVRLIYSGLCEAWQLFENAISVTTGSKNIVDVVVTGTADGDGEVQVFHRVPVDESSVARVCGFVQEHVDQMVGSLERTRYFRCGACGTLWGNNTDADAILRDNHTVVQCNGCGRELVLLDALEQMCRGKELDDLLREARERVSIRIDSQSKEWVMVGEVMAVVAQADQVFQPYSNTYYAIDGHIEFKNEASRLSGRRVLVQLKHGDSYTYHRERDGKDVFYVKDPGHAIYWRDSDQPVFLVIRSSRGDTQWMNVTEYIRNHPTDGLKRIEFEGTPLTPLAILRLRDMLLENT